MFFMNIKDIEKFIEDNNITFDFENNPRFIDYIDTFPTVKNEQVDNMIHEVAEKMKELGKDKQILIVDSINGGLKEI